jgi:hypothetical protein
MYLSLLCKAADEYGTAEYAGTPDPRSVIPEITNTETIFLFI